MAYEQRDNSGIMFVNDKKESEKHPDRKGEAVIDGVGYFVSGWLKKTKSGDPFLSLSFTPKDKNYKKQEAAPSHQSPVPAEDGSVPF